MPQYTFKCDNGHHFARIKKIDERDDPVNCPECDEPAERTIANTAPPKFEGDGWTERFHD